MAEKVSFLGTSTAGESTCRTIVCGPEPEPSDEAVLGPVFVAIERVQQNAHTRDTGEANTAGKSSLGQSGHDMHFAYKDTAIG